MKLQIASTCFGPQERSCRRQLEAAAEAGFQGVVPLPGDQIEWSEKGLSEGRTGAAGVPAAAWDTLLPADAPALARAPASLKAELWRQGCAQIPAVLQRLQACSTVTLVLDAGPLEEAAAERRGARVLGRLRDGSAEAASEAMEPLATAHQERERQWESLARFLHSLHQAAPGLNLALYTPEGPAAVLDPAGLSQLRGEAGLDWLGYWHDCGRAEARAHLGLEEAGVWLDSFAAVTCGASLQDWAEGRDLLLPGEGQVDFRLVGEYLPHSALRVLAVAPFYPREAWREAGLALASQGIS